MPANTIRARISAPGRLEARSGAGQTTNAQTLDGETKEQIKAGAVNEANAYTDAEITAALRQTLRFTGYVAPTAPASPRNGELWIEASAMPGAFPVQAKRYDGDYSAWIDYNYIPNLFDLFSLDKPDDDEGWYWFAGHWNRLDFEGSVFEQIQLSDAVDSDSSTTGASSKAVKTAYDLANGKLSPTGNAATATKLATARKIALTGAVTGSSSFDGSDNLSIATTRGAENITTTASTQAALSAYAPIGGNALNVTTGLSAGTRGLQTLLQELVNRSHGHTLTYVSNCNCNCGTCA